MDWKWLCGSILCGMCVFFDMKCEIEVLWDVDIGILLCCWMFWIGGLLCLCCIEIYRENVVVFKMVFEKNEVRLWVEGF